MVPVFKPGNPEKVVKLNDFTGTAASSSKKVLFLEDSKET